MSESPVEQKRVQEFLSRPQFIRFSEVFETYQRLLNDNRDDPKKLTEILERIRTIFDEMQPLIDSEGERVRVTEFNTMKEQLLLLCENGEYTKEKMAHVIAASSIAEKILEQWNPPKPGRQESGNIAVNEVLEYGRQNDGDEVYINLIPTAAKESELLRKAIEGLRIIAKELNEGSLREVKTVMMVLWLFDRLARGAQLLFVVNA